MLHQEARNLMLQMRIKYAVYLPCIWEISATIQLKICLFCHLPYKNVKIKMQTKHN
jgi:hypothetical protein